MDYNKEISLCHGEVNQESTSKFLLYHKISIFIKKK